MIDWEALAPLVMSTLPWLMFDTAECRRSGAVCGLRDPRGIRFVGHPAADESGGEDADRPGFFIYDDYDNRKLQAGVVYSQSVNSYVAFAREGDWLAASPGVIVLQQKKADNRSPLIL